MARPRSQARPRTGLWQVLRELQERRDWEAGERNGVRAGRHIGKYRASKNTSRRSLTPDLWIQVFQPEHTDGRAGVLRSFDLPVSGASDGLEELVEACQPEGAVDRAGRLRRRKDRAVVFASSKNRGTPVREEPGMLEWMLKWDFPKETKAWARRFLERHR